MVSAPTVSVVPKSSVRALSTPSLDHLDIEAVFPSIAFTGENSVAELPSSVALTRVCILLEQTSVTGVPAAGERLL